MSTHNDIRLIVEAAAFAANRHRNQRRKDHAATPYINHPLQLACVLSSEGGIDDTTTLVAAILHDTLEDTQTTADELKTRFGSRIAEIVAEVTDDKTLPKAARKAAQIEHAHTLSVEARAVKLADKICNLRDVAERTPTGWSLQRCQEYFDWAKAVVDGLRGPHLTLERLFDTEYGRRPVVNRGRISVTCC